MTDKQFTFAELVEAGDIAFGDGYRTKKSEHGKPGLPILRVAEVHDGNIRPEFTDYVSETYRSAMGVKVSRWKDIVLTTKGTVGRVATIPVGSPEFAYSPQVCFFRVTEGARLTSKYLYYWFKSSEFWSQAESRKSQTDMADYLNLSDIRSLSITVPNLTQQQAIAGTLGALDDKIVANRDIADTIDALLRNMYRADGAPSDETRICDISFLVRESVKPDSLSGDEHYIGLEHMPRKRVWLDSWGTSSDIGSVKSAFDRGDILFGKLRPYFHKVGIAQVDGVCSTDIMVVRARKSEYRSWLLMALSSDEVVTHATTRSDGTRMPRAKWSDLADFQVPWPGAKKAACFERRAAPLVARAEHAARESHALEHLRDTLLPQLMSGKLRVRDAEKIVEDAV